MIIKKTFDYGLVKTKKLVNKLYEKKVRKQIKTDNFSIICSSCIGGIIYNRLGMKFLTPAINLWLKQGEFIKMISNLEGYMNKELKFIDSEYDYPVARIGEGDDSVNIYFNHADSIEKARDDWNKRRTRINYDNLYVILYDRMISKEDIIKLKDLPCKRLVVLSEKEYSDISYVKTIKKSKKPRPNDFSFLDKDIFGIRTFEKQFDYVAWLNGEEKFWRSV